MPIKESSARTLQVLPLHKESTTSVNLRDAVKRLAIDFFFKQSRKVADPLVECSGVAAASEILEDVLPYAVLGCKFALLFFQDDVQMFYVSSDNTCVGLTGYLPSRTPSTAALQRLYLVTITDEDMGTVTEAYVRTMNAV